MATKMKGFYKSFKIISQIFVVKEKEMEIGFPTDVKHVAHIGWDGSGTAPTPGWMSEYKSAPDFSTSFASIGDTGDSNSIPRSTWSSQDFEQMMMQPPASEIYNKEQLPPGLPDIPKKKTRKKSKSSSSSKSSRLSRERLHF